MASLIKSVVFSLLLMVISVTGFAQKITVVKTDSTGQLPVALKLDSVSSLDTTFQASGDTTLTLNELLGSQKDSSTVDSLNLNPKKKGTPLEAEIKYTARDSIRFSVESKKVYLYGEAQINYQDIELKAAYIEIDQETKEVYAEGFIDSTGKKIGMPEFKSGEQQFKAKRMRYNFETEKGKILDVVTQEGEGNLRGEKVKKTEEGYYYIEDGGYTTCDADEPHYLIKAKKLKVMPNDKIVSGPAFLMFEGVYTPLVVPFGWFPNKSGRKSGIIFPEYGESPSQGFFFRNFGYYFNLGDKMDLAVTGDIYTRGSYGVRLASNYRKRYKFNGNIDISHNSLRNSQPAFPDYSVQNNFFLKWRHTQDPKARPSTSFSSDVNVGTSSNFQNGLTTNTQDFLTNTFTSSIAFAKRWIGKPYALSVNFSHSQNTQTKIVNVTLPQIAFNVQRIYPFKRKNQIGKQRWYEKIGVSYSLRMENRVSTVDTTFFTRGTLDKMRNGVIQTIPISTSFKALRYFTVSPSVTYNERWFFQRLDRGWDNETQTAFSDTSYGFYSNRDVNAALNINTTLYGLVQFKKGWIRGIRHVFNPRVGFSYRPKLAEDERGYYGENGTFITYSRDALSIYGRPPTNNTGAVTYGFGNTLEMKIRSKKDTITGFKKVKILEAFNVSGSYNLFADSLNLSDIRVSGRTRILERLGVNFNMNLSPYAQDTNGRAINTWLVNETGKLTRLTTATVALTLNLNGKTRQADYNSDKGTDAELAQINAAKAAYIDFNVPWRLDISYNLTVNNLASAANRLVQTLQFQGDISLTPKWKVGFNSGYDFVNNDLSYTSLSIYRDLHCWEFSMTWVPFGVQQMWSFDLKVKSTILQDLKLSRRKDYFDF
ncbi:putative LPS assembly protein LptD [Flavobacteriales bacterium]|nr:putative LPS assembly protein LptD [Flavobacteriales bacterium]